MRRYWPYIEALEGGGYRGVVLDRESKPVGYQVVKTSDTVRHGWQEGGALAEADARILANEMEAARHEDGNSSA